MSSERRIKKLLDRRVFVGGEGEFASDTFAVVARCNVDEWEDSDNNTRHGSVDAELEIRDMLGDDKLSMSIWSSAVAGDYRSAAEASVTLRDLARQLLDLADALDSAVEHCKASYDTAPKNEDGEVPF